VIAGAPTADEQGGVLHLAFGRDWRGRSSLTSRRQRFPLRTTQPFYLDPELPEMAFVYVQNPTGGVFAGDRLLIDVAADTEVRLHVTTQSATKLYRMEGIEASQQLTFSLAERAYVEHVPDALIPQNGACYRQDTLVEMASGSMFIGTETIAPGRLAYGEQFAYERLELTTAMRFGARELSVERLRFEPGRARPDRAGVLGEGGYLVSLYALAPDSDVDALVRGLDDALVEFGGAAGALPGGAGALARVLASDPRLAERSRRRAWSAAREVLLGVPPPPTRK
jgi:urease accessory protein